MTKKIKFPQWMINHKLEGKKGVETCKVVHSEEEYEKLGPDWVLRDAPKFAKKVEEPAPEVDGDEEDTELEHDDVESDEVEVEDEKPEEDEEQELMEEEKPAKKVKKGKK
jgi:hypothetical protein